MIAIERPRMMGCFDGASSNPDQLFNCALASSHSMVETRAEIAEVRSAIEVRSAVAISFGDAPAVNPIAVVRSWSSMSRSACAVGGVADHVGWAFLAFLTGGHQRAPKVL